MAEPFNGEFLVEIPGISFKVSGGAALWDPSNTGGSNDSVASNSSDMVNGSAVRDPAARDPAERESNVAGSASAVPNFKTAAGSADFSSDPAFDHAPIGSAITLSRVVAISLATTMADVASMVVTLPDGTVMTLVGAAAATPLLFAT